MSAERIRLLTEDETKALQTQARDGDEGALNLLMEKNKRFVFATARNFFEFGSVKGYAPEDIVQIGRIGFFRACCSKTYDSNNSFVPYAAKSIVNEIMMAMHARRSVDDFLSAEDIDEGTLADEVVDQNVSDPETIACLNEIRFDARSAVNTLKPKRIKLISRLFGIESVAENEVEVAADLHVTRQAVSSAKLRIFDKLRRSSDLNRVWDEYNNKYNEI